MLIILKIIQNITRYNMAKINDKMEEFLKEVTKKAIADYTAMQHMYNNNTKGYNESQKELKRHEIDVQLGKVIAYSTIFVYFKKVRNKK